MEYPPFPGFRSQAFAFLRDLANNNDRDWFKERKSTFDDELKWPLECLVVDAGRRCESAGLPMKGDPKKSLFRIYRDTRFSNNKDPYKTHIAAVLSETASNKEGSGIYIHVEPKNCFAASGFWNPDNKFLSRIRTKIAKRPDEFLELVDGLKDLALPLEQRGEGLKRLPRGFEELADSEVEDFLKWKSFLVVRKFSQKDLADPNFPEKLVQFGRDVMPLLEYAP